MASKVKISLVHISFLVYFLLVVLVVSLLVREDRTNQAAFSLNTSRLQEGANSNALIIQGDGFHSEIKGVLAKTLINEDALLLRQLTDVPLRTFDIKSNFGLFSQPGGKLVRAHLSGGTKVNFHDTIGLKGSVAKVRIINDKALVGLTKSAGIKLVDMSDPDELKLIGDYPLDGSINSIVSKENTFYFAGARSGLSRLVLGTKKPVPEKLFDMESAWRLAVHGKSLAVGSLKGRVAVFEIDEKGELFEVESLDFQGQVRGVAFTEDALSIVFADGQLSVFDLSGWPKLTPIGQLHLPAQPMEMQRVPGQEQLVVSMVGNGFGLVDISHQQNPSLKGWFKVAKTYNDFNVTEEKILGSNIDGLDLISLEELEGEMSKLAPEATMNEATDHLQAWRQFVYGFYASGRVKALAKSPLNGSGSEPYLPVVEARGVVLYKQLEDDQLLRAGFVPFKEGALAARMYGSSLYVISSEGLHVFAIDSTGSSTVLGALPISGRIQCFELLDSVTAMVATYGQGVLIVDINDPGRPQIVSRLTLPGDFNDVAARDILVDEKRAYVAHGSTGVYVVDLSLPRAPEVVQLVKVSDWAGRMALYDDLLIVATLQGGLFLIDVKDPERALPVGRLNVPLRVGELAVAADGLIAKASNRSGTMTLPLPQRLPAPRILGDSEVHFDLPVIEKGQYLYLYDETSYEKIDVDLN